MLFCTGFGVDVVTAEFVEPFELTEVVEVFAEVVVPEVEVVPVVESSLIKTPLPPPVAAGKLIGDDGLSADESVMPSIVISTSASFGFVSSKL